MKTSNKNIINLIWDFFSSIKLAIVLISLIGSTSIIGTLIEQNVEPEKNLMFFKKVLGETLAPKAYIISQKLGLMDMYGSWWFLSILFLLCANLIICSFDRLPKIHKAVSEPIKPLKVSQPCAFSISKELVLEDNLNTAKTKILKALRKFGIKNPLNDDSQGIIQLYGQSGKHTRYAVYVIHLSIVLIFIGAVIGVFFGFNGFLNLPEGDSSPVAYSRQGIAHELGFTVKCDDFNVDFYGSSDMPKEYMSWLTIIDNNQEVVSSKSIEVNSPLTYKGYTFYQASYGPVSDTNGLVIFKITPKGAESEMISLKLGEAFNIKGTNINGKVLHFSPALALDKDKQPYSYTNMMNNPAVYIEFTENKEPLYSGWILKRYPDSWTTPDGQIIQFIDYFGYQYTGLQVRKDPGVWIVYIGCILITLGLYAAFFLNHKKMWILLREEKGKVRINVCASANKHKTVYKRNINTVFDNI
ncbi:ResB family protein [Candidatus Magnetoovum chiemensis]|nr:ResB family protein [Candidatus Magnetoovum chiemensis]